MKWYYFYPLNEGEQMDFKGEYESLKEKCTAYERKNILMVY